MFADQVDVEFGKHIQKGIWAFAGKALPAVYGIGFIFLVIRVLPENEYGQLVVIQTIYTVGTLLGYALAFQPLAKFAAETDQLGDYLAASLVIGSAFFLVFFLLITALKPFLVPLFAPNDAAALSSQFDFLPFLLFTGLFRTFPLSVLQSRYRVESIFWVDALFYAGTLISIFVMSVGGFGYGVMDILLWISIGQALSALLGITLARKLLLTPLRLQPAAFRIFWNFGKFTFGGAASYTLFAQLDILFVSSFLGVVGAAVYNAAKVFTRIFDMMAQVIQLFIVPFSSRAVARGEHQALRIVAEKAICYSTVALLPVFAAMMFFPYDVLDLVYAGKYQSAAPVLRVLSLLALGIPWNGTIISILTGIGKVRIAFFANMGLVIIASAGYIFLTPSMGAIGTSIGLVLAFFLVTFYLFGKIQKFVPLHVVNVVSRLNDLWMFVRRRSYD